MTTTRFAGLALGLTLSLGACGGDDGGAAGGSTAFADFCAGILPKVDSFIAAQEQAAAAVDPAKYGGTVVLGTIGDFADGMNHFVSSNYDASQHQQFVNLMTLVSYDEAIQPQPYLAESWETDDPVNPTVLTFHLRPDVFWHDGVRTTAEDVAFTYRVITDSLTAYPNAAWWDHYVRGAEGVEVVDSLTVRIKLRPHAEFMDAWTRVAIMPKHLLDGVAVTDYKQHPYGTQCPVGNGPFVFVEHRPQESWTFKANPSFPAALGGRPFVDRYVFRVIPEQATLLTDLLTENIDIYIAPRPDQAESILENDRLTLLRYPFRSYTFVGWNGRRPQLADARVRRALTLGTNRHEIVGAQIRGFGTVANTSVPPFHWAYDPTYADSLRYDPEEAKRLLDEAGWKDANGDGVREKDGVEMRLTLTYNQGNQIRQDIAEVMQAQLGAIGVALQPQVMEFGTMVEMVQNPERNFDAIVFGWVTEFKLDDMDLFHSGRIDLPYQFSGTKNPAMDKLLDTLQLVVDRDDAKALWLEYQRLTIAEQPYTFVYFPDRLDGVNKRVRDIVMDARGEYLSLKDIWIPQQERGGQASTAAR